LQSRPSLLLITGLAGINILVFILSGYWLLQSRQHYELRAETLSQNIAGALDQNVASSIEKIGVALDTVVALMERRIALSEGDEQAITGALTQFVQRLPEVEGVRVSDAEGHVILGNGVSRADGITTIDRDYFQYHRDHSDDGIRMSKPLLGRVVNHYIFVISRRYNHADGSFAGVVFFTINVAYFDKLVSNFSIGSNGMITVRDKDLGLITRFPSVAGPVGVIGNSIVSRELHQLFDSRVPAATYHTIVPADGLERICTYRRMDSAPILLFVCPATTDVMVDWMSEVHKTLVMDAGFLVLSVLSGVFLVRSFNATIRESKRNQIYLQHTSDGVYVLDAQGVLVEANQAFLAMLGYDQAMSGKRFVTDWDFERPAVIIKARNEELIAAQGQAIFETRFRREDGSILDVEVNAVGIEFEGIGYLYNSARDITERKRSETALALKSAELAESNADLEQFAYVASHDLQTPLRNVVSYTQLLERRYKGRLDKDADEFLGFIIDSTKRMTALINDLLDYSRITSRGVPLRPVQAREALALALSNLKLDLETSGAEMTVGALPRVMADQSHLVSLFQNLVGNAIKYRSPDRRPQVSINAEQMTTDQWRFSVADNGIGIDAQYHDKIFEIFQRLNPTSGAEGTGIGLTLCRRIVHRFGGTMWVESKLGEGTRFFFTLRDGSSPL